VLIRRAHFFSIAGRARKRSLAVPDSAIRERRILYNDVEFGELLDAMARQCASLLAARDRLTAVGILRRGVPIAQALDEPLVHGWCTAGACRHRRCFS
jgi:hypothetical protein